MGAIDFANPLDPRQKKLMKEFQGLLSAQLGETFDLPDYVPEMNALQLAGMEEAMRLGQAGYSPELQAATQRLMSGDPAYRIDPAMREQYFQAQLQPGNIAFQDNLRAIAEQYAGEGLGRSGDFQGALAQAAARYGADNQALLAGLVNADEQRTWEGFENAAQRQALGVQFGQANEMMPINTLMNAGMTQYGLDSERMQQEMQQKIMAEQPLANPLVGQWLPFGLTPYKVPYAAGEQQHGWQSALGMLTGTGMLSGLMNMGGGFMGNGRMY